MKSEKQNSQDLFTNTNPMYNKMTPSEMLSIRGGRNVFGPDKIRESDTELPDLTYTGPGGVQEADIEQPDLTSSLERGLSRPSRIAARIFS